MIIKLVITVLLYIYNMDLQKPISGEPQLNFCLLAVAEIV